MFVSKFWLTLLTLAMGAAIATLLLARHSHNLELEDDTRRLLAKDHEQAWALLKSEARVRLDEVLRISSDPDVMRTLDKASRTPEKVTSDDRAALEAKLRQQNENLESFAADLLVAVDRNGNAIAQAWEGGPQKANYGLGGFPAVSSALRGFMQDDVWALSLDGNNPDQVKVYRVATRPVISRGRYVGAIVHGQHLDADFARLLAQRLGAQVLFFRGSVVLSSAVPSGDFEAQSDQVVISELSDLLHSEELLDSGHSSIIPIGDDAVALYTLIRGEAALVEGSRVGYAIVRPIPSMGSSLEFLTNATLEEWSDMATSTSGIILIAFVFLSLVLGFVTHYFEHGRPLGRLRKEVNKLAARRVDRMNIYGVARKHRSVAESINNAMDKAVADVAEKLGKKPADIDQILSPGQGVDRVSSALFTFPEAAAADEVPPPPPGPVAPPAGPPQPSGNQLPPTIAPVVPSKPAAPAGGPAAPVPPAAGPPGAPPQPPTPSPAQGSPQPAPPTPAAKPPVSAGGTTAPGPVPAAPPVAPSAPKPPPSPAIPTPSPLDSVPSSNDMDDDDEDDKTEIAGVPEELLMASQRDEIPEDEETYFRQIFERFVETKRQCGEQTDNLRFERFSQTLRRNRDALIDRYGCRTVRFQVYIKEGKAALKATPVRS